MWKFSLLNCAFSHFDFLRLIKIDGISTASLYINLPYHFIYAVYFHLSTRAPDEFGDRDYCSRAGYQAALNS